MMRLLLLGANEQMVVAMNEGRNPIYYDTDGLIVHKGLDGGDTAQREGWYWFGVWIREHVLKDPWPVARKLTFLDVIKLLEPERNGVFYRHPKLPPWNDPWSKKFGFSRDQMVPLVAAMGVWEYMDGLRRLWNALPQDVIGGAKHTFNGEWQTFLGRRTVHTGDLVGPATINLFRRAWKEDPWNAGDGNGPAGEAELLANSTLKIPPALTDRDDTGDDLNHIVGLLMSVIRFPTATSAQALKTYAKERLVSYGSFVGAYQKTFALDPSRVPFDATLKARMDDGIRSGWTTDASRVYGAVRWYHRDGAGANPALAELYKPIIRRYLE